MRMLACADKLRGQIDAADTCGVDERGHGGGRVRRAFASGKAPRIATKGSHPQGKLGSVVRQRNPVIVKERI